MESKKKKNGHEEPRGKTGIKMQTYLRIRGGGKGKLGQSASVTDIYTLPNVK